MNLFVSLNPHLSTQSYEIEHDDHITHWDAPIAYRYGAGYVAAEKKI